MKIITKLLSLAFITIFLQNPVFAHTMMTSVSPADGEQLTPTPQYFSVQYSKAVRLVKLKLLDSNDKQIKLPSQLDQAFSADHKIALPSLVDGQYKLMWILLGKDGHKMKGKLSFSIAGDAK